MEPLSRDSLARGIEAWCLNFVESRDVRTKLEPTPPPDPNDTSNWSAALPARQALRPGRPDAWRVEKRAPRTPREGALVRRDARAQLMHTFCHHELQAAELFAWAVLAFPETPKDFRIGLVQLCQSELEHLALYRRHLETLGACFGDYPLRDWFWERVTECRDPASFVGFFGLGLEAANLEHSQRFATAFRTVGDDEGARILERVEREEVTHVAFALSWFEHFTGGPLDYERWRACLPSPLTPSLLRGRPLNRSARKRAGFSDDFLARLEAEGPTNVPARAGDWNE